MAGGSSFSDLARDLSFVLKHLGAQVRAMLDLLGLCTEASALELDSLRGDLRRGLSG